MLVLVPGGAVGVARYRGWRAAECQGAVWLTVGFFLLYNYTADTSAGVRQLVLVSRFLLPVLPVIVWCAATTYPALWRQWQPALRSRRLRAPAVWAVGGWILAVTTAVAVVHPIVASWDRTQAAITNRIYAATSPGAALLTNSPGTTKFVHPTRGPRTLIDSTEASAREIGELQARYGAVFTVVVDRSGPESFGEEQAGARAFEAELRRSCSLESVVDEEIGRGMNLRVQRVGACAVP